MNRIKYIVLCLLVAFSVFAQGTPSAPDVEDQQLQFMFDGAWLPDMDAAAIGAKNYTELKNLRYSRETIGLEGVSGYTKINTTPLSTYTKIRSGKQLRSNRTVKTYVLVQAENSGETASQVFQNQTTIPDQGDFEGTALHTDATGAGVGRFAEAPGGNIAYANGVESMVWGGEETRLGAFYLLTHGNELTNDDDFLNPESKIYAVNNALDTTGNTVNVGATDELITNGNMEADSGWTDYNGATDEQSSTVEKSGSYSWKFTADAAGKGIDSVDFTTVAGTTYYYSMWVWITPADTTLDVVMVEGNGTTTHTDNHTGLTGGAWWHIVGSWVDAAGGASAEIRVLSSTAGGATVAYVDDVMVYAAGKPSWFVMSTRPLQGVKFYIETANSVKSILDAYYWNGSSFTAVSSGSDGTSSGSIALAQTGTYSFTSTVTTAKPYHFQGDYLYCYLFSLSVGTAEIEHITADAPFQNIVDLWDGIPRQPISFQVWRNEEDKFQDFTLEVNAASYEALPYVAQLDGLGENDYIVAMFDERMSALNFDFMAGWVNENADLNPTIYYWNGSAYTTVGTLKDDTLIGTTSFAQNGLVWWNPPAETSEAIKTDFGVTGYAYKITFGTFTEKITNGTMETGAGPDNWNDVETPTVSERSNTQYHGGSYSNKFTVDAADEGVQSDSTITTKVNERYCYSAWVYPDDTDNVNVAIRFADDGDYAVDEDFYDLTQDAWNEVKGCWTETTKGGATYINFRSPTGVTAGTWYIDDVSVEGALSGKYEGTSDIMTDVGDIALDVVTGAPAQLRVSPFVFPSQYKNTLLLCGYSEGREGNRCDYSGPNTTEDWNGELSSRDGTQSLYFGGSEDLTAGAEIYNRYGSSVITQWVGLKNNETYVLQGDGPEDFTIHRVSTNIGCPAPLTLASVEVAYSVAEELKRNMLFWLSHAGPYSFDGQVLEPIAGVNKYFDPNDDDCINFDEIERSRGWYDSTNQEYNLQIPSGAGQATNNIWLVYNLIKKKWFRKDTGGKSFPQVAFPVTSTTGNKYVYGGIDSGYMMRLENGNSWDGGVIEQVVETGDFWPTNNIWDLTRIRQIKFVARRISETHSLIINHDSDTDQSLGMDGIWMATDDSEFADSEDCEWVDAALATVEMSLSGSVSRVIRDTVQDNLFGWTHRFQFLIQTDETTKGIQPLGWGIVFHKEDRRDE